MRRTVPNQQNQSLSHHRTIEMLSINKGIISFFYSNRQEGGFLIELEYMEDKKVEIVVGAFIQNKGEEIALFKSKKWGNVWVPPGGHVDYGEKIEDAVRREVKEETGVDIKDIKLIRIAEIIEPPSFDRKAHLISFHFLCSTDDEFKLDNDEVSDYKWFSIEALLKSNEVDEWTKESIRQL